MVRITCSVDLKHQTPEGQSAATWHALKPRREGSCLSLGPVPDLHRVPGGRQDGQVVRAEGQRAHVGAVAAQREASRLAGLGRLDAEGLHRVVLQQQRHLQLAAGARQELRPPGGGTTSEFLLRVLHERQSGFETPT